MRKSVIHFRCIWFIKSEWLSKFRLSEEAETETETDRDRLVELWMVFGYLKLKWGERIVNALIEFGRLRNDTDSWSPI